MRTRCRNERLHQDPGAYRAAQQASSRVSRRYRFLVVVPVVCWDRGAFVPARRSLPTPRFLLPPEPQSHEELQMKVCQLNVWSYIYVICRHAYGLRLSAFTSVVGWTRRKDATISSQISSSYSCY